MQILDVSAGRVATFLNSIERGSENSRKSYQTSLIHFAQFLSNGFSKPVQTPDTVIPSLKAGKINTYELLDSFVTYLTNKKEVAPLSLKVYVSAVKSYLEFNDIDIVPSKFRRRVKVPKYYPDQEEPLTLPDIRHLLEFNSNHRLRTYILLLVSSGMRAMEGASLRLQDVDFTTNPTRITIRREYSKTKRSRIIYCSDEATIHIKKLIEMHQSKRPEDFIFAIKKHTRIPDSIYSKLLEQFQKLQHIADKDTRKESSKRRKITLHSFRRTCFSIINENTNSEFANYYLGHHHSVYWTHTEKERRNLYRTKCMPFLTVYQETRDNTIEASLREKDRTIKLLTNRITDIEHDQKIIMDLLQDPQQLKKKLES